MFPKSSSKWYCIKILTALSASSEHTHADVKLMTHQWKLEKRKKKIVLDSRCRLLKIFETEMFTIALKVISAYAYWKCIIPTHLILIVIWMVFHLPAAHQLCLRTYTFFSTIDNSAHVKHFYLNKKNVCAQPLNCKPING